MRQIIFLLSLLAGMYSANAQLRIQAQSGLSSSLRPVSRDSILSAKASGMHLQLRVAEYYGHLGLGFTIGYLQQNVRDDAGKNRPPSILNGLDTATVKAGGVKAVYLLVGPEICLACNPKLKFNIGLRAGVSLLQKKEPFQLFQQSILQYENTVQSKAPFTINAGIGVHYFVTPHFGIGAMADWHHFAIKANNRDIRHGINNILLLKQKKDLFNLGLSLAYKF